LYRAENCRKSSVSCLCLTYNHAQFLGRCIESIWEQDYRNIEILALDDGSPDGSAAVLQKYAESSPVPMTIIAQEHSGNIAKNFNTLIRRAQGEYITILSTDDFFEPDAFSSKIPHFEQDENLCFVGNLVSRKVDENNNVIAPFFSFVDWESQHHETIEDMLEILFSGLATIQLQGTLFRKDYVDAVGGFDEDLLGDDLILFTKVFLYMLKRPELKFKVLDKVAINYRYHSSNLSHDRGRAVPMYVEWKKRYFPNCEIPPRLFETFKCGLRDAFISGNEAQLQNVFTLLADLLQTEPEERRVRFVDLLFVASMKKHNYLIPFIFEIRDRKDFFSRRTSLIVFGFKMLEKVEKYNARDVWLQLRICKLPVFQKHIAKLR